VLTRTPHKESPNRPNIAGLSGGNPIRKAPFAKTKAVAQKKQRSSVVEKIRCLVRGETYGGERIQCERCKNWSHEDCAKLTNGGYYFCDTCAQE
jgi:hypothetical protein